MTNTLVLLDQIEHGLHLHAQELLSLAHCLGPVHAVAVSDTDLDDDFVRECAQFGVEKLYRATSQQLFRSALVTPTVDALEAAVDASQPSVVIVAATYEGREIAARLAVRKEAGLVTDVASVKLDSHDHPRAYKSVFAGAWTTESWVPEGLAILTVKPNSLPIRRVTTVTGGTGGAAGTAAAEVADLVATDLAVTHRASSFNTTVVSERVQPPSSRPSLAQANVVIAGGRGTDGDFTALEELADQLGGAVGTTRDCVDLGWIDHDAQIGQTGTVIAPKVYLGAGISGAVQHRAGMQTSGYIIAVNNDPANQLFDIADLCVVGDLHEIVPAVVAEVKRLRG
ncbi:electron transfer flavoprotein subunit alpha/FixB family protein [Micrococcales bacterium 31B]|nr:electron transfer flavoprotein subunit alpha/FixB family protein [Micrococcales bacterium 31B]